MGAIQMLLRSKSPQLSVSAPNASNTVFLNEPAPATQSVSAGSTATAAGGTGAYTYSWTYISGDAGIALTTGSTSATAGWSATVNKNSNRSATWRITVNDGVNTVFQNIAVSLTYQTDL